MFEIKTTYLDNTTQIKFPCDGYHLYSNMDKLHIPDSEKPTAQLFVNEITYEELKCLEEQFVDPDVLNFLAQRLDSFGKNERKKFDAVVRTFNIDNPRELVNLTFNMHYYTLIDDMSDMENVGKEHMLTRKQAMSADNSEGYDFYNIGQKLMESETGRLTQYGIIFVNDDLPYEKPYVGNNLPNFEYDANKILTLMINGDFNRLKSANEFENGVTMKDLINLTYGLDNITVIDCVRNDKELGRLVKEQKSEDYFQDLDEEIINMLDDEKVGMKYRDAERGYYVEDHYVARHDEIPEIYDGKTLPKDGYKAEKGEIRVAVSKIRNEKSEQTVDDAIWIKLPLDKEKIQTIKHFCEVDNISECAVCGVYTPIPNMEFEKYSKRDSLENFDKLVQAYENLNDGDKVKFKALAERRCPEDAESALELMNELSEYEFAYYAEDAAGFAMEYMIQRMPQGFCEDLFDENDWKSIGERLIARSDSKMTEYGVISARGKGLYEEIVEESETQELGGMQM